MASGCIDPRFLDLGTSWRWVVSFTPRGKIPPPSSTHWIGDWLGPRAGLDDVEKRKFLTLPGLELRPLCRPARSQSLSRLLLCHSWRCIGDLSIQRPTIPLKNLFFFILVSWGETESIRYVGHYWPIVPAPDDGLRWVPNSRWDKNCQEKPKYLEKTRSNATLSTTNPTWPDLGSNPSRRDGKPTTNRLSYGTALKINKLTIYCSIGCAG
jgi:hypothetical protein